MLVVLIACVLDLSLWFLVREIQFHCEPFNYHEPVSNLGFLARIPLVFLFLSNLSSFSSLIQGLDAASFLLLYSFISLVLYDIRRTSFNGRFLCL
jgi:hypothetical protein